VPLHARAVDGDLRDELPAARDLPVAAAACRVEVAGARRRREQAGARRADLLHDVERVRERARGSGRGAVRRPRSLRSAGDHTDCDRDTQAEPHACLLNARAASTTSILALPTTATRLPPISTSATVRRAALKYARTTPPCGSANTFAGPTVAAITSIGKYVS